MKEEDNEFGNDNVKKLYQYFIDKMEEASIIVESGKFGAMMNVELINDGPVTFVLDTNEL